MTEKAQFGIFSPQAGMSFKSLADRATQAEKLGYHSLWLVDHFWNRGIPDADCLESTALMSGIAARTEKLRIGTLVLCNSFRNPALLAKSLTTIDHVSNGRLEIGLGAGWMDEEYRGYGYEFPTMGTRLRQLEEGLQVMKLLFSEKKASFKGRYYSLDDAYNNPKPMQSPHPPITIGGSGEKVMLKIVAKHADRWNCPAGYRSFEGKLNVLKEHCTAVGRAYWNQRHAAADRRTIARSRKQGHHVLHRDVWRFRAAADHRSVRARGDAGVRLNASRGLAPPR